MTSSPLLSWYVFRCLYSSSCNDSYALQSQKNIAMSLNAVHLRSLIIHLQYVPPLVPDFDGDGLPRCHSTPQFCLEEAAVEGLPLLASMVPPSLRYFVVDTQCRRLAWEIVQSGSADSGCSVGSTRSLRRIVADVGYKSLASKI